MPPLLSKGALRSLGGIFTSILLQPRGGQGLTPLGSVSFAQEERASGHSLTASPLAVDLLTHGPCGVGDWVGRHQQVSTLHEHTCFKDAGVSWHRTLALSAPWTGSHLRSDHPAVGQRFCHFTDPKG